MQELLFEWDGQKNRANIIKHGISFEEAATVFYDPAGVLFDDPDHSAEEERFLIIGMSETLNLLIVSHCIRNGDAIRIISARKANKKECTVYVRFGAYGGKNER